MWIPLCYAAQLSWYFIIFLTEGIGVDRSPLTLSYQWRNSGSLNSLLSGIDANFVVVSRLVGRGGMKRPGEMGLWGTHGAQQGQGQCPALGQGHPSTDTAWGEKSTAPQTQCPG